jgi:hypothetical protein
VRVVVLGAGATGGRCARQLASVPVVDDLVLIDPEPSKADQLAGAIGGIARVGSANWPNERPAAVVVAFAGDPHAVASAALDAGAHVVSMSADVAVARSLETLDQQAAFRGLAVVMGAGFAPGLSCLLARHAASEFDDVDEIHVASSSTGGPECAREHARLLRAPAEEWDDGAWVRRRGGRELVWFPDPVGGLDCYRAARAEPYLLHRAFPSAVRLTSRVAGRRVDRLTHRVPILRPPHAEGSPGGLRVEVRGRRGGAIETVVFGVMDRPSVGAGAIAAVAVEMVLSAPFPVAGAWGLAERVSDTAAVLADLAVRGVKAARFVGTSEQISDPVTVDRVRK